MSSNMDTVSSVEMFKSLARNQMLTCFHKYININDIIQVCNSNENQYYTSDYFILSTGITENDF